MSDREFRKGKLETRVFELGPDGELSIKSTFPRTRSRFQQALADDQSSAETTEEKVARFRESLDEQYQRHMEQLEEYLRKLQN